MNNYLISLPVLFSIALVSACAPSGESPFESGGGSTSNIISSEGLSIGAAETNLKVIKFAAGDVTADAASADISITGILSSTQGIETEITVIATDNNNIPVNSGTVYFKTQYGTLSASSCQLVEGSCSITWKSTNELEPLLLNGSSILDLRNTIVAWTYGAEAFTDLDADGLLSDSEVFDDTETPYLDINDNGVYDPLSDPLLIDGSVYAAPDSAYQGPDCDNTTRSDCGSPALIPIFARTYIQLNYE